MRRWWFQRLKRVFRALLLWWHSRVVVLDPDGYFYAKQNRLRSCQWLWTLPETTVVNEYCQSGEPAMLACPQICASFLLSFNINNHSDGPIIPPPGVLVSPLDKTTWDFIPADYSERITLPKPPTPSDWESVGSTTSNNNSSHDRRTNCPHLSAAVRSWFDPGTWPDGNIPSWGQNVTIPLNSAVLIDRTIAEDLGYITIPSGSDLILGERTGDDDGEGGISLRVRGIDVQGYLVAGSRTCRIDTSIVVTLIGSRPWDVLSNPPSAIVKGITVTGTITLHGKRFYRSWTRLARSVVPGDTIVFLQHAVNWRVGQQIVLVTTAMKDSREWHQNEVHRIAEVNPVTISRQAPSGETVGAVIVLQSGVQFRHVAHPGYQAEVGLLSRAITIQGDANDSEPTDPDPLNCTVAGSTSGNNNGIRHGDPRVPCPDRGITGYGGHISVHGTAGRCFVQGVEFYRMG